MNFDSLTVDDRSVKNDSANTKVDSSNSIMTLGSKKEEPDALAGFKVVQSSSYGQNSPKKEAEAKHKLDEMKSSNSISSQALFSTNIS